MSGKTMRGYVMVGKRVNLIKGIRRGSARRQEAERISPQLDWSEVGFNFTGYGLPEAYRAAFEQAEINLQRQEDE